jgi:hypothetical protein
MPSAAAPSVLDPISRAIDDTVRILFRPFDATRWLVLGFCAWIAQLGENGGTNFGSQLRRKGDPWDRILTIWGWIEDHLALVIVLAALAFLLGILLLWISSRGKLLFVEGVIHDRAAVSEPWVRFATPGNSLFWLRLVIGLAFFAVFLVLGTFLVRELLAMGLDRHRPGPGDLLALSLWALTFAPLVLAALLVGLLIEDFVVPILWLRRTGAVPALREALAFLSVHAGIFVLYVLVKFVLALCIFLVSCIAVCVTCCIVALPYVGVVILLPLYVFHRCYSLEFLSQFGADYAALAPRAK